MSPHLHVPGSVSQVAEQRGPGGCCDLGLGPDSSSSKCFCLQQSSALGSKRLFLGLEFDEHSSCAQFYMFLIYRHYFSVMDVLGGIGSDLGSFGLGLFYLGVFLYKK